MLKEKLAELEEKEKEILALIKEVIQAEKNLSVVETWKLEAQRIAEKRREITPPRAVVFDRNGNKVVENKTYYNLMMVEEDMVDFDTVAFAKLLGMTKDEVLARMRAIRVGEKKPGI